MSRTSTTEGRRAPVALVGIWVLSGLGLTLLATAGWIRYRFGSIVLEQFILHVPLNSEGFGSTGLAAEAFAVCVALPLALLLVVAAGRRRWRQRRTAASGRAPFRPALIVLPAIGLVTAMGVLLTVVGVPQYAVAHLDGRTFEPYYVVPQAGPLPKQPLNLITIYLESAENTFADPGVFGRNLLAPLDKATAGWIRYDGLEQYPDGGWTMAGLVGSQCGIPLKSRLLVEGINPNDFGEQVEHYLPGATCLGDVLGDAGYTNAYLGGAHSRFAGKDTYLADHGYDIIRGLGDWEAAGEDGGQISVWGLSDARLFSHARDTVKELRAAGAPFNLTILTLDTHEPAAIYPSCTTDDADPMATALSCSLTAVAGFLDELAADGQLQDTVVVVMGDHLKATAEGGSYKAELEAAGERTIVLRVWSPHPASFARPRADQFSMLATTLDLLGLQPPEGRAGLGVSLLDRYPVTGTALELSEDEYRTVVTAPSSELYRRFWEAPAG